MRRFSALPTYEYRCVTCEHQFERFQRMSDEPVKECEVCGEPVKRLLFPVAIQFKGKGFYTTDYARKSTLGSTCNSTGSGSGSGSESSSSRESDSSDGGDAGKAKSEPSSAATSDKKPVTSVASSKSD
jgi:putative FmdB family regulatory protein